METVTDALKIQCSEQVSAEAKADFKALIQQVLDHSPSDSTVEGELLISELGIDASVHIRSQDVDFKARKIGDSAVVLKSVRNELFRQIMQWRDQRTVEAAC